jgi:membrane protease YdiL (CAAX protease family)
MKKLPVTMSQKEFEYGIGLLAFQRLFLPTILVVIFSLLSMSSAMAELNGLYFFINFVSTLILFRNFLWAELGEAVAKPKQVVSSVAIAFGIYYVLSSYLALLIQWLDPAFSNLNDASIDAMTESQFALMAVGTVLFVPPAEELLFRGVLFNKIYEKHPILAWILSITLFSLIHIIGYIGEYSPLGFALAFLQYLPAGIALCFSYVRSGTIFAPILLHTTINTLAIVLQFLLR